MATTAPNPRTLARELEARASLPEVPRRERLRGYAATGLPFHSGHILAMRESDVVDLDWDVHLAATPATRAMNAATASLPRAVRNNHTFLAAAGRAAGPLLRAGRMRLAGTVPSGSRFKPTSGESGSSTPPAPASMESISAHRVGSRRKITWQTSGFHSAVSLRSWTRSSSPTTPESTNRWPPAESGAPEWRRTWPSTHS